MSSALKKTNCHYLNTNLQNIFFFFLYILFSSLHNPDQLQLA